MSRLSECMPFVFAEEGGFSNDPHDSGGATNHGITQNTLAAWRKRPVSINDVLDLGKLEATAIYGTKFWNTVRADDLPAGVDLWIFDLGINIGPGRAVMQLQELLGVEADGWLGKRTLASLPLPRGVADMINELHLRATAFYRTRSSFARYGRGWLARCERRRLRALHDHHESLRVCAAG